MKSHAFHWSPGRIRASHQIIGNARTRHEQRRHLPLDVESGVIAGCLPWPVLPGLTARRMIDEPALRNAVSA